MYTFKWPLTTNSKPKQKQHNNKEETSFGRNCLCDLMSAVSGGTRGRQTEKGNEKCYYAHQLFFFTRLSVRKRERTKKKKKDNITAPCQSVMAYRETGQIILNTLFVDICFVCNRDFYLLCNGQRMVLSFVCMMFRSIDSIGSGMCNNKTRILFFSIFVYLS